MEIKTEAIYQIAAASIALSYKEQKGLTTFDFRPFEYQTRIENSQETVLKLDSLLQSMTVPEDLQGCLEILDGVTRVVEGVPFILALLNNPTRFTKVWNLRYKGESSKPFLYTSLTSLFLGNKGKLGVSLSFLQKQPFEERGYENEKVEIWLSVLQANNKS